MRTIVRLLPVILVPLVAGCYSMNIECYYPDNYDFSKLQTFDTKVREAVTGGESPEGLTFFETEIQKAIKNDLEMKGIHATSDSESDFQVVIRFVMGRQAGTGPREIWGQWIDLKLPDSYHVYDLGITVIDVVDNHTKQRVWRGIAEGFGPEPGLSEKKIAKTVKKILADFPPARN